MDWIQVVALAVLQGLTEFLPISSSAHLILLPLLVAWPDQGLAFDVAVHVGTLLAVLVYFRRDLSRMIRDWLRSLAARHPVGDSSWVWYLLAGTVPVGLCAGEQRGVRDARGSGLRAVGRERHGTAGEAREVWREG